jgi:hypothetical protein
MVEADYLLVARRRQLRRLRRAGPALEREDLRGRVIGLVGHGHLAVTTKAFDEAAHRVSRQLLMQTLVNLIYGIAIGASGRDHCQ